jgi:hypothetical protein
VFKPVWLDGDVPEAGPRPTGTYDDASLWWRHEDLHRTTLTDYAGLLPLYRDDLLGLEARLRHAADGATTSAARHDVTRAAFDEAATAEQQWLARIRPLAKRTGPGGLFGKAWRGFDRAAGRRSA